MKQNSWRFSLTGGLALAVWMISLSTSQAGFILFEGANDLKFRDLENVYRLNPDTGTYAPLAIGGQLQAGDILQGVLWATTVTGAGGQTQTPGLNGAQQITAVFSTVVESTVNLTNNGGPGIVLAPSGAFTGTTFNGIPSLGYGGANVLPGNTMLAVYTDPSDAFYGPNNDGTGTLFTGNISQVQAAAETGQLLGAFGYGANLSYDPNATTGNNLGNPGVGYWYSTNVASTSAIGNNAYVGLQLLQSSLIHILTPVINFNLSASVPPNSEVGLNNPFDLTGHSVFGANAASSTPIRPDIYSIQSNDPVDLNASLLPEPSSLVLFSIAFGSLGAVRAIRRRKRTELS